ncbi:MAG: hypothetical protein Fur0010_22080 [Bdellovibrio sp.]
MTYKKRSDLAMKLIGDQLVIIDSKVGRAVHRLNEVGVLIWESLDKLSVDQIVDVLIEEFEVDADEARKDLLSFITELEALHLIEKST